MGVTKQDTINAHDLSPNMEDSHVICAMHPTLHRAVSAVFDVFAAFPFGVPKFGCLVKGVLSNSRTKSGIDILEHPLEKRRKIS